jgi:hypothetical protein
MLHASMQRLDTSLTSVLRARTAGLSTLFDARHHHRPDSSRVLTEQSGLVHGHLRVGGSSCGSIVLNDWSCSCLRRALRAGGGPKSTSSTAAGASVEAWRAARRPGLGGAGAKACDPRAGSRGARALCDRLRGRVLRSSVEAHASWWTLSQSRSQSDRCRRMMHRRCLRMRSRLYGPVRVCTCCARASRLMRRGIDACGRWDGPQCMDRGPSACVGSGPERTPPPLCVLNVETALKILKKSRRY